MCFGKSVRQRFGLDPKFSFLNHGSFGTTPLCVLAEQHRLRAQMEKNPVRFLDTELPQRMRDAAARLAGFVGARPQDLVFVDNATTGVNSIVRSLSLRPGDRIVTTNHVYGAIRQVLRFVCDRAGAQLEEVFVPFPLSGPEQVLEALEPALARHPRLAVLDHITSVSGMVLPIAQMVRLCHDRDVSVLVDGAHAPGQVPLDLTALNAEWYTGNAHKWLFAPKGCAFLVARHDCHDVHPTVISHGYGQGLTAEFDYVGTRDPTCWLAIGAALDFVDEMGFEAMGAYNRQLVNSAAPKIERAWETTQPAPEAMTANMITFRLPPGLVVDGSHEEAFAFTEFLRENHDIEVPVFVHDRTTWVRISGQVYNEAGDYDRLIEVILAMDH